MLFTLIPAVGAAAPLAALPAITSTLGAQGWASYAIGQSIGGGAAILVEMGWGLTGSQRIARSDALSRLREFEIASTLKVLVYVVAAPAAGLVANLVSAEFETGAVLSAVGATAGGLATSWFFIGSSEPLKILLVETLPRVLAILCGSIVVRATSQLAWMGSLQFTASITCLLLSWWVIRTRTPGARVRFGYRDLRESLRGQYIAVSGRLVSGVYITIPTTLVGIAAPSAVAEFAAVERLMRMALVLLQAFPNALQSWVGADASRQDTVEKIRVACGANLILGVISATVFFFVYRLVEPRLFSGSVSADVPTLVFASIVILLTCCSRAVGGLGLVRMDRVGLILASSSVGAVTLLAMIFPLVTTFGAKGAFVTEAAAELVVLCIQLVVLVKVTGRNSQVPSA